jgi:malonate-semialdehyde dehydrogenase (acetylating)/methylmalonate-semialdehyde dehydrogenase
MTYIVPHLIDGKLYFDTSSKSQNLYNPATGEIAGRVDFASNETFNKAIYSAKNAFNTWSTTTPIKRTQILFKFRELMIENINELAKIVTYEHGKTIEDAKGSISRAIELIEHHCGLNMQMQTSFSANISSGIDCYNILQPLGVCAGVSPFNFPVMVPAWMIIPAIASGNTFILKPSEQTPRAATRFVELLYDAGLPDGVVNVVHGDKSVVDNMLTHPDISAITAVASTPVAKYIYNTAIINNKRSHTFGGAKNHCAILPDANFEQACNAIVGAAFGSAGERCMALSVVVTVGEVAAKNLLKNLIPAIKNIKIDIGDSLDVDMGPLISKAHRERVLNAINKGVAEGANLIIDGREFVHPKYPNGFFIGPSLFDNVTANMSIYQQEIFGPVLVIIKAQSLDEAIALINANQYGNGAAIFTSDGYSARYFTEKTQAGMIGVNIPIPVPVATHPFGGFKDSAFGDNKMHGLESIHFYTKIKTITSKWPESHIENNAFTMPMNG